MTEEMVEDYLHSITEDIEPTRYEPSNESLVFLEDMTTAICHTDNCEYKMSACGHARLSAELLKAMLDHYASVLDKKGYAESAAFLRSEM